MTLTAQLAASKAGRLAARAAASRPAHLHSDGNSRSNVEEKILPLRFRSLGDSTAYRPGRGVAYDNVEAVLPSPAHMVPQRR